MTDMLVVAEGHRTDPRPVVAKRRTYPASKTRLISCWPAVRRGVNPRSTDTTALGGSQTGLRLCSSPSRAVISGQACTQRYSWPTLP